MKNILNTKCKSIQKSTDSKKCCELKRRINAHTLSRHTHKHMHSDKSSTRQKQRERKKSEENNNKIRRLNRTNVKYSICSPLRRCISGIHYPTRSSLSCHGVRVSVWVWELSVYVYANVCIQRIMHSCVDSTKWFNSDSVVARPQCYYVYCVEWRTAVHMTLSSSRSVVDVRISTRLHKIIV